MLTDQMVNQKLGVIMKQFQGLSFIESWGLLHLINVHIDVQFFEKESTSKESQMQALQALREKRKKDGYV